MNCILPKRIETKLMANREENLLVHWGKIMHTQVSTLFGLAVALIKFDIVFCGFPSNFLNLGNRLNYCFSKFVAKAPRGFSFPKKFNGY